LLPDVKTSNYIKFEKSRFSVFLKIMKFLPIFSIHKSTSNNNKMQFNLTPFKRVLFTLLLLVLPLLSHSQERRAMTYEDVMGFHHLHAPAISHNGQWVAYHAWPDRGDGYGVLVSADGATEHQVVRGQNPRFSANGQWVLFTQRPPFHATEGVPAAQRPNDSLVVIRTSDGNRLGYGDVRRAAFSQTRDFLFVHHQVEQDTNFTRAQNEKLRKAGTRLLVRNLGRDNEVLLPFVDQWTVDSLATTLVYTVKDTLETNNGLFALNLANLQESPVAIDNEGKSKFNRFTWFEKESRLAYIRAEDLEKDTIETAALFIWDGLGNEPGMIMEQANAPEGMYLPFDNRLSWTNDGRRLFFGFRPARFTTHALQKQPEALSVTDSILLKAEIDIWHGEDPFIKTHEKELWNQVRRQNLMAVYHLDNQRMVPLADESVPDINLPEKGDFAIASTILPHAKRITWEGRFRDVYAVNITNGERTLLVEESEDMTLLSPNGRFILYFHDSHWHVYNTRTGERYNLTETLTVPFYNETMDRPATPNSYRIAGWMDDEQSVLLYDRYDVWHANLATRAMRNVTGGQGRLTETVLRIRKLDDEPLFGRREEVLLEGFNEVNKVRAIYTARLDREGVSKVLDTGQNLRLRLRSGDGNTLVYTRETFDMFPDLWVTNTRFRNPVQVSNLQEQVLQFNWGTAELISYKSADGVPLQGIVVYPGDYEPGKQYPVFVYYYEKYSQRLHDFNQTVINHRPGFGLYSSNGYAMLLPDIHFIEGRPGMSAVKSLVPAVQKIIDMGIADPDAIGLHGHSWSGYQTAYVVTQTDIFRAAIAGAPVSNMTSAYGGIRWGTGLARLFQYETGQSRLGASIFEQRHLYIENSPLFYANEINTPLLIMHGDVDEAVPWEQSIELYLAMRRAGKDIIFLQYRDELHHPRKYPNKLDYTIRMKEYFDFHLKGIDPPQWIREGIPYMGR
jgi:dipeptidyl aminopeptidase/acylaminoacyl peptidase